jgi:hypothetical protein
LPDDHCITSASRSGASMPPTVTPLISPRL